jgi:type IV pilus assembly protein PilB
MALAMERGLAFCDLDRVRITRELRDLVPLEVLQELQVVPVKREGQTLWVATADPDDMSLLEEVRKRTQYRVVPVLALPDAIEAAIARSGEE